MPGPDLAPHDLDAGPSSSAPNSSATAPLTPEERRTRILARRATLIVALVAAAAAVAMLFVRRGPSLPPYAVVFAEGAAQHKAVGPGIAPLRLAPGADVDLVLRPTEAPRDEPRVVVCADVAGVLKPIDARVDAAASGALHVRVHADTVLALPGTQQLWIVVAPAAADLTTACELPPPRAQMLLVKLGRS